MRLRVDLPSSFLSLSPSPSPLGRTSLLLRTRATVYARYAKFSTKNLLFFLGSPGKKKRHVRSSLRGGRKSGLGADLCQRKRLRDWDIGVHQPTKSRISIYLAAPGPGRKIEDWDIAGCSLVSAMMPSRHHIYDRRWINERSRTLPPSLSLSPSFFLPLFPPEARQAAPLDRGAFEFEGNVRSVRTARTVSRSIVTKKRGPERCLTPTLPGLCWRFLMRPRSSRINKSSIHDPRNRQPYLTVN